MNIKHQVTRQKNNVDKSMLIINIRNKYFNLTTANNKLNYQGYIPTFLRINKAIYKAIK